MSKDYGDDEKGYVDNLFIAFHEPLDLLTDLIWLFVVVNGQFETAADFFFVNGVTLLLLFVNMIRMLSARRSRKLIHAGGLRNTRGARLREVVYAAQQVMFEDVPSIVLGGYMAARLLVMKDWKADWIAVTLISMVVSELGFVKFGRAISRAGLSPAKDPILPMFFLAFMPPGLKDSSSSSSSSNYGEEKGTGAADDERLWGVAACFNDRGDDSIDDINALLGSHWF